MTVTSGRVVDGKIVVNGEPLPEGTTVTIVSDEPSPTTATLTPEQDAELLAAIEDVKAGRAITAAELFDRLSRK